MEPSGTLLQGDSWVPFTAASHGDPKLGMGWASLSQDHAGT